MLSLGVGLFGFILFGTLYPSCTWICFLLWVGKFSAIISSNTSLIPFPLSSPSETPIMCKLAHFISSHISHMLLSCFFIFLSAVLTGIFLLFYLSSRSLIHFSVSFSWLFIALHCFLSQKLNYLFFFFTGSSLWFLVPCYSALHLYQ